MLVDFVTVLSLLMEFSLVLVGGFPFTLTKELTLTFLPEQGIKNFLENVLRCSFPNPVVPKLVCPLESPGKLQPRPMKSQSLRVAQSHQKFFKFSRCFQHLE